MQNLTFHWFVVIFRIPKRSAKPAYFKGGIFIDVKEQWLSWNAISKSTSFNTILTGEFLKLRILRCTASRYIPFMEMMCFSDSRLVKSILQCCWSMLSCHLMLSTWQEMLQPYSQTSYTETSWCLRNYTLAKTVIKGEAPRFLNL